MKRPSCYLDRRGPPDLKMTPLIDVVFLLLIFFVWTASFRVVEYLLPSSLLTTGGSSSESERDLELEDFDRVVVKLLWQDDRPAWLVNEVPAGDLKQVRHVLAKVAEVRRDVPVVIDPEHDVPLGHVIDVYDISRLVGFEKVQFAASEEV